MISNKISCVCFFRIVREIIISVIVYYEGILTRLGKNKGFIILRINVIEYNSGYWIGLC